MTIQAFEFDGEVYFANGENEDTIDYAEDNNLLNTPIKLGVPYVLLGVTVLPVTKTAVSGSNCNFSYRKVQGFDHIVHLLDSEDNKIMIKLIQTEGECYSGWSVATFVHVEVLDKGVPITHRNKTTERVTWVNSGGNVYSMINSEGVVIAEINVSSDKYYPADHYFVNLKYFKLVNARFNTKPTVYVLVGDSGVGKSLLVSKFTEQTKVWDFDAGMPEEDEGFEVYVVGGKSDKSEALSYLDGLKDRYKLVKVTLSDF